MARVNLWGLCLRNDVPTRGINTNNFLEAANRVLKEKILGRIKAFSLTHLSDIVFGDFSEHYCIRLTDVAVGRLSAPSKNLQKCIKSSANITEADIEMVILCFYINIVCNIINYNSILFDIVAIMIVVPYEIQRKYFYIVDFYKEYNLQLCCIFSLLLHNIKGTV